MRVVLIRHGQTDWNEEGIFRGRIDVGLNRNGIKQSRKISKRLKAIQIDAVYSSPLRRAVETAGIVASPHDLEVTTMEDLIDIDFGKWEGLSRDEIKERFPSVYKIWVARPEEVEIPEAETLEQVRKRVESGLQSIFAQHPTDTVVIVSHGLINKIILCVILGLDNAGFWNIKQDNSAVNIFEYNGKGAKLFLLNDRSHVRAFKAVMEDMLETDDPVGRAGSSPTS